MVELKRLATKKDFKKLEELAKPNPQEEIYWKNVCKRFEEIDKNNPYAIVAFYQKELAQAKKDFKDSGRVAISRFLNYELGKSLETLATHHMEDIEPLTRSNVFLKAVEHYEKADELVEYMTDFIMRRCEALRGAGCYRGITAIKEKDDNIKLARMLAQEHTTLFELSQKLFAAFMGNDNIIIMSRYNSRVEKMAMAVKKIESDVNGCGSLSYLKIPEDKAKEIQELIERYSKNK